MLVPRHNGVFTRLFSSAPSRRRPLPVDGRSLKDFISPQGQQKDAGTLLSEISDGSSPSSTHKTFHIKTYGCQMNVNDTDIVRTLLFQDGWSESTNEGEAMLLLTNTCAIREGAERKVWQRLKYLKKQNKIVGVLVRIQKTCKVKVRVVPHPLLSTGLHGGKVVN